MQCSRGSVSGQSPNSAQVFCGRYVCSTFILHLDNISQRIGNINSYFTFCLYTNVCRSLFEKHKLLFSFLLAVRILMNENKINMEEWRFLLAGGSVIPEELNNPASDWLSERAWKEILTLCNLEKFREFGNEFSNFLEGFKKIFDSTDPQR